MSGLYHYQGMPLHYLSEDSDYAVYYKKPKPGASSKDYYNPYVVYAIKNTFTAEGGWSWKHKKVAQFAGLYDAVQHVRTLQGYSI